MRFGNEAPILSAKSVGGPFSSYRPEVSVALVRRTTVLDGMNLFTC